MAGRAEKFIIRVRDAPRGHGNDERVHLEEARARQGAQPSPRGVTSSHGHLFGRNTGHEIRPGQRSIEHGSLMCVCVWSGMRRSRGSM